MTRKQHIALAAALRQATKAAASHSRSDDYVQGYAAGVFQAMIEIERALFDDNSRFDSARFEAAVYAADEKETA